MTCDECFEAVSASIDGELPGDDREAMHEHLDECSDCQRLRARLLSLSAEMKVQPFPEPGPAEVKAVLRGAVSSMTTSRWSWLRRLLRFPWENPGWRHGLRLATFGGASGLAALGLIVRWLLPPLGGTEATALRGLPDPRWLEAAAALPALSWMPLLVILVAAWTGGWPALLADLRGETRARPAQVAAAALGMAVAGPFAALPLLADLQLGGYILVCCLWTGLCLLGAFAVVAFKTARPLPRLALDFALLALPLGLLEGLARKALALPQASECQPAVCTLVGSLPFASLTACLALLVTSATLLGAGVAGFIPSYRGAGGRAFSAALLLSGLGCLGYGLAEARTLGLATPSRAELGDGRRVYLLAAGPENPWVLPSLDYPRLKVVASGDPRGHRLAVASAYLDWNEPAMLEATRSWAESAPGVAWGLSAFVDSLGQRQGPLLTVPSDERQALVQDLLGELRWRVLAQTALSPAAGSICGRIIDADGRRQGLRLRLLEARDGVEQARAGLSGEAAWAAQLVAGDDLAAGYSANFQRTAVSGPDGEFRFAHIPPGRYLLALLPEQDSALTVNSSLPGVFEVEGAEVALEPIHLSVGAGQAEELPLQATRWQSQGPVEFSVNTQGASAALEQGGLISTLIDDHPFDSGTAHLKVLLEGPPESSGLLKLTLLSKDGRRQAESELRVGAGLSGVEIAGRGREGYLQIALLANTGSLTVRAVRLEIRP